MSLPDKFPAVTVDCIIELPDHPLHRPESPALVLIERRFPPLGWALPGGFVDVGEPLAVAAVREAAAAKVWLAQLRRTAVIGDVLGPGDDEWSAEHDRL